MFKMQVSDAINSIVEAMLPIGSKEGLFIMVDMRLIDLKSDQQESVDLCFIFERSSSYTKVFVAASDRWVEPEASAFTLKSDHDSCWRTDGTGSPINECYFRLANLLNKNIAPRELNQFVQFHTIKKVKMEIENRFIKERNCSDAFLVSYSNM